MDLNRNFPSLAERDRFLRDPEFSVYEGRKYCCIIRIFPYFHKAKTFPYENPWSQEYLGNSFLMQSCSTFLSAGREPETVAILDWSARHPFVLSADLHDGAVLVTYPFDFQELARF